MDTAEVLVVGAGVVGLAVARALALQGREVVVAEAGRLVGSQTSARNSGVIHAGLYYPPGSLKARLCVEGRERLYAYCRARGVEHRRCGKLIVATSEGQLAQLDAIALTAANAGVEDLRRLDGAEAMSLEPGLQATGALLSPSTGILDVHAYMLSLQGEAEANGAVFALGTEATSVTPMRNGLAVAFGGATQLLARVVVNAAGLGATTLAARVSGLGAEHVPRLHLAKGSYFSLRGRSPFSRLIYPVPQVGGLGVHLTLDLAGQARFGPDVEWVEAIDYRVDPARALAFYEAVRAYWPRLEDGRLAPDYAGVRPKLSGPGEPPADFRIDGADRHGIAGLINLFGIESPGLTASLALADVVAGRARETLED
ncbi:NAD(P)/FAD-dependent oxidoreductase [Caulobacter sp. S45]|uniref:NAD(P)/FAD-dependent oxidoreductase n=1 Tax=Caulobacter sp. S45 TaxID=1641861 RepID=UPI001576624B|nr:NAD(P)/FAD-dependent oxidoreductase [Caulobacter sp. S45]